MTFLHLASLMQTWGYKVDPEHYLSFSYYLKACLKKHRVLMIWDDSKIEAVVIFFLTNDYSKLYKKGTWDVPLEDESGSQIYVDKLVCRQYTSCLGRAIRNIFEKEFPQVEEAFYHRAPNDRCVRIKRRMTHAYS